MTSTQSCIPIPNFSDVSNAQQKINDQALRLFATEPMRNALQRVSYRWQLAHGDQVSANAQQSFSQAMEEFAFNYLLKGIASDGNYPQPIRLFMPPHVSAGKNMPGSRIGGDNPDNSYRLIGIYPSARYQLLIKPKRHTPASLSFTLVANFGTSKTIETIELHQMHAEADGSYRLQIDPAPADGRINHLRSNDQVKFLYIRDTMSDWANEAPVELLIERLDPPSAAPISDNEIIQRASEAMCDEVPLYYWFSRLCSGKPLNTMIQPMMSGTLGGLVTQAGSQGFFRLDDETAYIIQFESADARYLSFSACDWWFRSIESWYRSSCLTGAQMHPDADGGYTLVLSSKDPGVHNWIDPGPYHEVLTIGRWQGLPEGALENPPKLQVRAVPFSEVKQALPTDMQITPEQRTEQRLARFAHFTQRFS